MRFFIGLITITLAFCVFSGPFAAFIAGGISNHTHRGVVQILANALVQIEFQYAIDGFIRWILQFGEAGMNGFFAFRFQRRSVKKNPQQ